MRGIFLAVTVSDMEQSKFFRCVDKLLTLAQFDTNNPASAMKIFAEHATKNVTFAGAAELDAQLYRRFDFTPAMIKFAEDLPS